VILAVRVRVPDRHVERCVHAILGASVERLNRERLAKVFLVNAFDADALDASVIARDAEYWPASDFRVTGSVPMPSGAVGSAPTRSADQHW
jgi:hypothetical protein